VQCESQLSHRKLTPAGRETAHAGPIDGLENLTVFTGMDPAFSALMQPVA
jgi:hypothetical protein